MPITPLHLGPALLIGLLLINHISFPAFIVGNVIIDFEQLIIISLNLNYPIHGFIHSFLGGIVISLPITVVMSYLRKDTIALMSFLKLEQETTIWKIFLGSL